MSHLYLFAVLVLVLPVLCCTEVLMKRCRVMGKMTGDIRIDHASTRCIISDNVSSSCENHLQVELVGVDRHIKAGCKFQEFTGDIYAYYVPRRKCYLLNSRGPCRPQERLTLDMKGGDLKCVNAPSHCLQHQQSHLREGSSGPCDRMSALTLKGKFSKYVCLKQVTTGQGCPTCSPGATKGFEEEGECENVDLENPAICLDLKDPGAIENRFHSPPKETDSHVGSGGSFSGGSSAYGPPAEAAPGAPEESIVPDVRISDPLPTISSRYLPSDSDPKPPKMKNLIIEPPVP